MVPNVFCRLTPAGRSAIASTWVQGENLNSVLDSLFVTEAQTPARTRVRRPSFGYWAQDGTSSGEGLVVCRLDHHTAEIHSHGGVMAPQLIADSLIREGFVEWSPREMAAQGQGDWVHELRWALVHAPTRKTALRLLKLYSESAEKLLAVRTAIESGSELAAEQIRSALNYSELGRHLVAPWKVVICGQPNVGKSSLINVLSGFERSIVHNTPGTTRDVVSLNTAFNGWPVELTDTAGLRDANDEIEQHGIQRARDVFKTADLRIALFDASNRWRPEDDRLLESVQPEIVVHNKMDCRIEDSNRPKGLQISATESDGIEELIQCIVSRLVPDEPGLDQWMPVTSRQQATLEEVLQHIDDGQLQEASRLLAATAGASP